MTEYAPTPEPALDALKLFDFIMKTYPEAEVANSVLQHAMNWAQRGHYQRARDTLIACGALRVIRGGQGGRLTLTHGRRTERPILGQLAAATERELYPHLIPHLSQILRNRHGSAPSRDLPEENVAVAVPHHPGRTRSARYSHPDITAVVRRPFTNFEVLEVHAFEVKGYWLADRTGLYESAAQRAMGLCTHAWLVVYLPDDAVLGAKQRTSSHRLREHLTDLEREAKDLDIGFVEVSGFSDNARLVHRYPKRVAPDPRRLDDYLGQACPDLLSQVGIETPIAVAV